MYSTAALRFLESKMPALFADGKIIDDKILATPTGFAKMYLEAFDAGEKSECAEKIPSDPALVRASMVAMSHLSDAQMELDANPNRVRQRINFVKFVMVKTGGNLNMPIDADQFWSDFNNR